MLNAVLFTLIFGVISVLTLEDENSPLKSAMTSMDRDNDFMKRSDSLFEPLTLYKRYYSLDTLGGLGLGKRAEERRQASPYKIARFGLIDDSRYKKAFNSLDSLGGMGLGKRSSKKLIDLKRDSSLNYFDSLGGIGLGKK
ncbi:unnamed protein product, partial [Mesorhabditis belari]|uniref:Uncharacterized protein n=1 Tax=Mesorhabditis belari TaxID=2138241 RepID=A0AAF3EFA0_9BILA